MSTKKQAGIFVRNFVFGVEDSLVSTVGLLSGIASVGVATDTIFLTGTVLIFVEALSMATGSFLSEESEEEYEKNNKHGKKPLFASIIMFFSYFITGFVPLFPYILFERDQAFPISIAFSLAALFVLGLASARLSQRSYLKKGLEMLILGGVAIFAGIVVGHVTAQ